MTSASLARRRPWSDRRRLTVFLNAELVVRVANGPPPAPADGVPSGGYGLVALGEPVRTLGGRLSTGPRLDGGFEVEAVLPM